jgi:hypothetical protein
MATLNRTIADVRRRSRRRNRIQEKAATTITAMRGGQALHHRHEWYGPTWWLSDGKRVADEVAQLVIKNPAVVGVGDALPLGTDVPAQTFRYVE